MITHDYPSLDSFGRLLDGGGYLTCQFGEFFLADFHAVGKVEVGRLGERYEVNVGVGDVDADDGLPHFDAGAYFFQSLGHTLGKEVQLAERLIVEVEDVVDLLLGDAEDVSACDGVDVEEGEAVVGLADFVAGDFAVDDAGEDGGH